MLSMLKRSARVLWEQMLDNCANLPGQIRLYPIGYDAYWALIPENPEAERGATQELGVGAGQSVAPSERPTTLIAVVQSGGPGEAASGRIELAVARVETD